MEFAVIGGDMRQVEMAESLAADGHMVRAALIDAQECSRIKLVNWREAVSGVRYVILPLPALSSEGVINAPMCVDKLDLYELLDALVPAQVLLAGRVDVHMKGEAARKGLQVIDYFEREELAVVNAGATAEGAVQILMEELPRTLSGSQMLVVGFGRIGKLTALKLQALGAHVTVSARKHSDFAWIDVLGFDRADTRQLYDGIEKFDAVINTVPARVITKRCLERLKDGCLCLDLASKPGGIDLEAAAQLGTRAIWALSLPGKVAPVTSGTAIKDTVYNIISELECTC